MKDSKKSDEIVTHDMSHFLDESLERLSDSRGMHDLVSGYLDVADKIALQNFALRKQASAQDLMKQGKRSLEMAINEIAEAHMAEWLLKKRDALLEGKK